MGAKQKKGGRVTLSPAKHHRNCRPPGCPGIHLVDDPNPQCSRSAFTCGCGKRWVPSGPGWARADG